MPELEEPRLRHLDEAGFGACQSTRYVYLPLTQCIQFPSYPQSLLVQGLVNSHMSQVRFASALSNYKTTRKYGGKFIFLIHDLWGADGTQNSSAPYPGDNGNWANWDAYLTQWIADIKANSMTAGLSVDIWNEPDLTGFWNRPQAQYIQMWGRTYHRLRYCCSSSISKIVQY
jgi:hypothetical protein